MSAFPAIDAAAEAAAITAALVARADPDYQRGMRRTVASSQPAHAVRVPVVRRAAGDWSRAHEAISVAGLLAVASALWDSGWREERIFALTLLGRNEGARRRLDWASVATWSAAIDNWEVVDNMAGMVTGPMLDCRPELLEKLVELAECGSVWQRRLAIVTLIEAAREDPRWLPELRTMADRLEGDRSPTMRKAVDWARRTAAKLASGGTPRD